MKPFSAFYLVLLMAVAFVPQALHARCGDETVDPGEQCDDGNTANGDGCSSECKVEDGFVCTGGDIETPDACRNVISPIATLETDRKAKDSRKVTIIFSKPMTEC